MSQKKSNREDLLLIAFLLLALINKGPFSVRPTDPTPTPRGTDSAGKNSSPPDDSGVTTKNSPGPDSGNMPGGSNAGAPDKSKTMMPLGGMTTMPTFTPYGDNAGVQFAMNQLALINSQNPTQVGPGQFLVTNLGGTPGASVTTEIYNPLTGMYDSYTNNQYLFSSQMSTSPISKSPLMSAPEMVKQPMMAMPSPIPLVPPSPLGNIQTPPIIARPALPPGTLGMVESPPLVFRSVAGPDSDLVTIVTNVKTPGMSGGEMIKVPVMSTPNPLAFENPNNPSFVALQKLLAMMNIQMTPTIPNPLTPMPGLFSGLQGLLGGISNIFGTGIPGIPAAPRITLPDIMV